MQNNMNTQFPIPDQEMPEEYHKVKYAYSKMIKLNKVKEIDVDLQYPKMGLKNATDLCYIRKDVLNRLIEAKQYLPEGYSFKIYDAWRPFELQNELYHTYSKTLITKYHLQSVSEQEKIKTLSKFVSFPMNDRENPPVHTTGGAIDLTIIDQQGNELDMGSGFDSFGEESCTSYFEKTKEMNIVSNRRLLYHSMIKAGFTNLPSEWWHYDYGDRFWAYYKNQTAIYPGIFTIEELKSYEEKPSGVSFE
jgi:D-alanyl-D-alanine dipeptidase